MDNTMQIRDHLEYPEVTLYERVRQTVGKYPQEPAEEFYGKKISYEKLLRRIDKTAQAFAARGIRTGDAVTICLPNIPQALDCFYALNKLGAVANMGASMQGALDSVELAKKYPFVYAAVGIHPDHVGELNEEKLEQLRELSGYEKVVAIGEIGLDYYWDVSDHETQKYWFGRQLELALSEELPVVIHSREAAADTLAIMAIDKTMFFISYFLDISNL